MIEALLVELPHSCAALSVYQTQGSSLPVFTGSSMVTYSTGVPTMSRREREIAHSHSRGPAGCGRESRPSGRRPKNAPCRGDSAIRRPTQDEPSSDRAQRSMENAGTEPPVRAAAGKSHIETPPQHRIPATVACLRRKLGTGRRLSQSRRGLRKKSRAQRAALRQIFHWWMVRTHRQTGQRSAAVADTCPNRTRPRV